MCLVGQMSGLVANLNSGIFSDTTNEINVKLCLMVLHIPFHYTFFDLDIISTLQQCQTVSTENFTFLSERFETLWNC